jgi:hypothetical protein
MKTTKYIITYLSLSFLISLFGMQSVYAQIECPFGIENCRGGCGRWVDEDGDGVCDLSVDKSKNPIDTLDNSSVVEKNMQNSSVDKYPKVSDNKEADEVKLIDNHNNNDSMSSNDTNKTPHAQEVVVIEEFESLPKQTGRKPRYSLIFLSSLTIISYIISLLLVRTKLYTRKIHRRIWNMLLLVTFLVSCILGLVLVIQINYGIWMGFLPQFLKWHVDFGIGMTLISLFHIFWHIKYFKNIFKKPAQQQ